MTAMAIMGTPLSFRTLSSFSGPSTASPISFNRTSEPFTFFTIRSLNSSSVFSFPNVRMESSVASPEIFPEGNSTFSLSNAACTSEGVSEKALSLDGENQIRMAYFFSPQITTLLTPGTVCKRSTILLFANSVICNELRILLCSSMMTTGSLLASAFDTTGGASRSLGSERVAWDTLSRTSLAASSRLEPSTNSTVMLLLPCELCEDMFLMPAMPLIAFSSGSVIWVSMISALAPG